MRLIASIHDITPGRVGEADALRAILERAAPGPAALLVIPRHAGTASWRGDPVAAWLRERAAAGDEIVVHGWAHMTRRGRDGPETAGLAPAAVARLVGDAVEELRAIGLAPAGFIAPAYGPAAGLPAACAGAGLRWWATRGRLEWEGGGRWLPSVGPGASRPLRRALSPAAARLAAAALAGAPVLRLDIHTADARHPRMAAAAAGLARAMRRRGRASATHAALLPPVAGPRGAGARIIAPS